eukprot:403369257
MESSDQEEHKDLNQASNKFNKIINEQSIIEDLIEEAKIDDDQELQSPLLLQNSLSNHILSFQKPSFISKVLSDTKSQKRKNSNQSFGDAKLLNLQQNDERMKKRQILMQTARNNHGFEQINERTSFKSGVQLQQQFGKKNSKDSQNILKPNQQQDDQLCGWEKLTSQNDNLLLRQTNYPNQTVKSQQRLSKQDIGTKTKRDFDQIYSSDQEEQQQRYENENDFFNYGNAQTQKIIQSQQSSNYQKYSNKLASIDNSQGRRSIDTENKIIETEDQQQMTSKYHESPGSLQKEENFNFRIKATIGRVINSSNNFTKNKDLKTILSQSQSPSKQQIKNGFLNFPGTHENFMIYTSRNGLQVKNPQNQQNLYLTSRTINAESDIKFTNPILNESLNNKEKHLPTSRNNEQLQSLNSNNSHGITKISKEDIMKIIKEKIQQTKIQLQSAEGFKKYYSGISRCMKIQKFDSQNLPQSHYQTQEVINNQKLKNLNEEQDFYETQDTFISKESSRSISHNPLKSQTGVNREISQVKIKLPKLIQAQNYKTPIFGRKSTTQRGIQQIKELKSLLDDSSVMGGSTCNINENSKIKDFTEEELSNSQAKFKEHLAIIQPAQFTRLFQSKEKDLKLSQSKLKIQQLQPLNQESQILMKKISPQQNQKANFQTMVLHKMFGQSQTHDLNTLISQSNDNSKRLLEINQYESNDLKTQPQSKQQTQREYLSNLLTNSTATSRQYGRHFNFQDYMSQILVEERINEKLIINKDQRSSFNLAQRTSDKHMRKGSRDIHRFLRNQLKLTDNLTQQISKVGAKERYLSPKKQLVEGSIDQAIQNSKYYSEERIKNLV